MSFDDIYKKGYLNIDNLRNKSALVLKEKSPGHAEGFKMQMIINLKPKTTFALSSTKNLSVGLY